jgi:hypothetical protein
LITRDPNDDAGKNRNAEPKSRNDKANGHHGEALEAVEPICPRKWDRNCGNPKAKRDDPQAPDRETGCGFDQDSATHGALAF